MSETIYDDLFLEEIERTREKSYAEELIQKVENNVKHVVPTEQKLREDERKELTEKLKSLHSSLNKCKNNKNFRLRHLNAKNAETRKRLRHEIEEIKGRLLLIDDEEKGSEINATSLINTSKAAEAKESGKSDWDKMISGEYA